MTMSIELYYEGVRCKFLWAAVLRQTAHDYLVGRETTGTTYRDQYKRTLGEQARAWIYSDNEEFPSFVSVCHYLHLGAEFIRRKIEEAKPDDMVRKWQHLVVDQHGEGAVDRHPRRPPPPPEPDIEEEIDRMFKPRKKLKRRPEVSTATRLHLQLRIAARRN